MCGIAQRRAQRESPIGIPSATPARQAIPNPSPTRSRLGTTSDWKWENSQRSWNSTRIVDKRGKNCEFACAVQSCHAASSATGTAISAPIFAAL